MSYNLSDYPRTVSHARRAGAWDIVGRLSYMKVQRRPSYLRRNLLLIAQSPQGEGHMYDHDWKQLDDMLKLLAELMFLAIEDKWLTPLTKNKKATGSEIDHARAQSLLEQARVATECLDLLPKDGKGFAREVDQADVHLHDVNIKIYQETRKALFDMVVPAMESDKLRDCRPQYVEWFVRHLGGPYGSIAAKALQGLKYPDRELLVEVAERIVKVTQGRFVSTEDPYKKVIEAYVTYFGRLVGPELMLRLMQIHMAAGATSRVGFEAQLAYARKLRELEEAAENFAKYYSYQREWVVKAVDVEAYKITLQYTIQPLWSDRRGSIDQAIDGIKRHIDTWRHSNTRVRVVAEVHAAQRQGYEKVFVREFHALPLKEDAAAAV